MATIVASRGRPSTALATDSYVTGNRHCDVARDPPVDLPLDRKSHIPQQPKPDPARNAADTGREPIVYRESTQLFEKSFSLSWTEGCLVPTCYVTGSSLLQSHRVIFPDVS